MKTVFEEKGFADYKYWLHVNRHILEKINDLIDSIKREGAMKGIGKPEKLKYCNGAYSRRIDEENRLIYRYSENEVTIVSCKGHYDNI